MQFYAYVYFLSIPQKNTLAVWLANSFVIYYSKKPMERSSYYETASGYLSDEGTGGKRS
jgi:hypothetical protein